jgi:hypothetical protein
VTDEARLKRRRVLLGALAGAVVAGVCPNLAPHWQLPCKLATLLIHSWVAP